MGGLGANLSFAIMLLSRRLRQERAEPGSGSLAQGSALGTLYSSDGLTIGELARAERVKPSTMTVAVDRLQRDGYVRRANDSRDKRLVRVEITEAGRQMVEHGRSDKAAFLERRMQEFGPSDRATLRRAVELLLALAASDIESPA